MKSPLRRAAARKRRAEMKQMLKDCKPEARGFTRREWRREICDTAPFSYYMVYRVFSDGLIAFGDETLVVR